MARLTRLKENCHRSVNVCFEERATPGKTHFVVFEIA